LKIQCLHPQKNDKEGKVFTCTQLFSATNADC
jgi:hypothetical protein